MADATGVEGGGTGQEEFPLLPDARSRPRGALASQCPSHLFDSSCRVGTGDATLGGKEKEMDDAAEGAGPAEAAGDRVPEAAEAIEGADEARAVGRAPGA
eukprot:9382042-Pyramimonas_sp.AAC.1